MITGVNATAAILVLGLVAITVVYFLPSILASILDRKRSKEIWTTNCLWGWTGVGWFRVLRLALANDPIPGIRLDPQVPVPSSDQPPEEPAPSPPRTFHNNCEDLKSWVPARFMNQGPFEFERFIANLFLDKGHEVYDLPNSGDFGADLIAKKDKDSLAIQVKRYATQNLVGVQEVNQVIGARTYYKCAKAMVVTTSGYSWQAQQLAKTAEVELWDWEQLYAEIRNIYLEGKDLYEFFAGEAPPEAMAGEVLKDALGFSVVTVEENTYGVRRGLKDSGSIFTVVHVKVRNTQDVKTNLTVATPILIDTLGNQWEAENYWEGGFTGGTIYPRAAVTLIYCWLANQVPKASCISQVIVRYALEGQGTTEEVIVRPPHSESVGQEPTHAAAAEPTAQIRLDLSRPLRDT